MGKVDHKKDRRTERQAQAAVRQEESDGRTVEQKVALAHSRRGQSKKELTRLGAWPSAA